jgi:trigger factor
MTEMQVSVENAGCLNRRLSVVVPIVQLEQTKKRRLAELAKTVRVDGFRPGKVPVHVIEKLYGQNVWEEVVERSLKTSLASALAQNSLHPVGSPYIDSIKAEPGNDLEYTAAFEVYPQILTPELTGVNLEKLRVEIIEADIDAVLEKMRLQHLDWVEVSRRAQLGDQITFDLSLPAGEVRKNVQLILEEEGIPEEFSVLLASTAGETLSVLLPSDKNAGQTIPGTVQVKKISEPKLAELDDAFANRFAIQEGGIDNLRVQVRQFMQDELDRILREKLRTQVIEHLLAAPLIDDFPKVLLNQEFLRLEANAKEQEAQQVQSANEPLSEERIEALRQEAKRRVKIGLLFGALIEKHQLCVDEMRVQQTLDRLVSVFQFEQVVRNKFYKDENVMRDVRSFTLEEQVIDKLLEQVEYTEKVAEYREIMNFSEKNKKKVPEEAN